MKADGTPSWVEAALSVLGLRFAKRLQEGSPLLIKTEEE